MSKKIIRKYPNLSDSKCYLDNTDIYLSPYRQSVTEKQHGHSHSTLFSAMKKSLRGSYNIDYCAYN